LGEGVESNNRHSSASLLKDLRLKDLRLKDMGSTIWINDLFELVYECHQTGIEIVAVSIASHPGKLQGPLRFLPPYDGFDLDIAARLISGCNRGTRS
jgi:hypothetical protein